MAELSNYLVLERCTAAKAAEYVATALTEWGWQLIETEDPRAKHIAVWVSTTGLTVIELEDWIELNDWDGADRHLANYVSCLHPEPVVLSHRDGAGENDTYLCIKDGRTTSMPRGALAPAARFEAHALIAAPGVPALRRNFRAPFDQAGAKAADAVNRYFRPVLEAFGLQPAKGRFNHPATDGAVAFSRKFGEATELTVSFDYNKPVLTEMQCHVFANNDVVGDGEMFGGSVGVRAAVNNWQDHPEYFERDMSLMLGELARSLSKAAEIIPDLEPLLERASQSEEWREAVAAFDHVEAARRIGSARSATWKKATLISCDAKQITVETTTKDRFTFRLDTTFLWTHGEIAVGDIVDPRSGALLARLLRLGGRTMRFTEMGEFLEIE